MQSDPVSLYKSNAQHIFVLTAQVMSQCSINIITLKILLAEDLSLKLLLHKMASYLQLFCAALFGALLVAWDTNAHPGDIQEGNTVRVDSLPHGKWKKVKQQPSMLPGPAVPGCC